MVECEENGTWVIRDRMGKTRARCGHRRDQGIQ